MQDRYAGDIGDFSKYALLRKLVDGTRLRLGLNWYRYPDEANTDGRHVEYLADPRYRECDPVLHEALARVVERERSVAALQRLRLFERAPVYYAAPVVDLSIGARHARAAHRRAWLDAAVDRLAACDALCLDPDNGLEIASCPATADMRAGKYAYYHEVERQLRGKSVAVIYQHFDRRHGTHREQIECRVEELRRRVDPDGRILGVRFRPYTPRAYLIIAARGFVGEMKRRIEPLFVEPWAGMWDNLVVE